jgi:membrane-associated phospholipid phosphatase
MIGEPRAGLTWHRFVAGAAAVALLFPNSSVLEHRVVIAVFLFALATGRGRQFLRDWLPLTGAAALFVVLRQLAAGSPFPRQGWAVSSLEAQVFGGETPTALLQSLRTGGAASPIDAAATAVHASYFFAFVVVGVVLWLRARPHFAAYTKTLALTFALGLVGYFALPTEPPWLVARVPGAHPATRVIVETTRGAPVASAVVEAGRSWQNDPDALGDPNPAAAMPSVHTAITAALAFFLFRVNAWAGITGLIYTAGMGLALIYLGEHFALDVLAGIACGALANALCLGRRSPSVL